MMRTVSLVGRSESGRGASLRPATWAVAAMAAALLCLSAGLVAADPLPGLSPGGLFLAPQAPPLAPQGSSLLKFTLEEDQQADLNRALRWTWLSVAAYGLNAVSGVVALAVDPLVGGILGLGSLVFWGISTWNMATALKAVEIGLDISGSDAPRPSLQSLTSLIAAISAGAFIISVGYAFADDTGVAYVFIGISALVTSISGGIAVISTLVYAGSVDHSGQQAARAARPEPPLVPVAQKRSRGFYLPLLRLRY